MPQRMEIVIGERYGRLIIVSDAPSRNDKRQVIARCDCGVEKSIALGAIRQGATKSCGCLNRETSSETLRAAMTKHGCRNTPEYRAWRGAINRCENPGTEHFIRYGGRGISVHDSWRHDFAAFLAYIGPRPTPQHSLDRYPNNDGNYEPGNVRWATSSEQARNRSIGHRDQESYNSVRKAVVDQNGKIYSSVMLASKALGIAANSISAVARGRRSRVSGYVFKYLDGVST